jgi:peptidoglycan-associated lipoprotein
MIKSLSYTLFAASVLAACSSPPLNTPAPVSTAQPMSTNSQPSGAAAQSAVATVTLDPLDDPKGTLAARSVYFAFDNFDFDHKYEPLVQAHGQFLQTHPQVQIRVEGNADERGSREYNLSLGEKRAEIVAKRLEVMGAKPDQVEAVSYGEERPKATGHDEESWAENRRADIRYVKR